MVELTNSKTQNPEEDEIHQAESKLKIAASEEPRGS